MPFLALLLAGSLAATAQAQVTPEQSCEAGKTDATGKYSACISKAEKTFVLKGDAESLASALAKCAEKFGATWEKLEQKAVDKGTTCPSTGDEAAVQDFLDACVESVASAAGGEPLPMDPVSCNENLTTCEDDLESCESGGAVLSTSQTTCWNEVSTPIACAGTGQDGESQAGLARSFTDNGDGTITDDASGLMWEKKSDDNSIHDKDNFGTWAYALNVVKVLNGNAAGCVGAGDPDACCTGTGTGSCSPFAGYTDWRLPNINEALTLINYQNSNRIHGALDSGCTAGCTVTTCSCTRLSRHWSTTADVLSPSYKFILDVLGGRSDVYHSLNSGHIRAVRSGS